MLFWPTDKTSLKRDMLYVHKNVGLYFVLSSEVSFYFGARSVVCIYSRLWSRVYISCCFFVFLGVGGGGRVWSMSLFFLGSVIIWESVIILKYSSAAYCIGNFSSDHFNRIYVIHLCGIHF